MNNYFERPIVKLDPSRIDKIFIKISWVLFRILWIATIFIYSNAPESVPTHFNINGKVDDFGSKFSLFILPIVGTIIFFVLGYLNTKPHIFNYPQNINEKNYLQAYSNAISLLIL